jgi:hypothetical protein
MSALPSKVRLQVQDRGHPATASNDAHSLPFGLRPHKTHDVDKVVNLPPTPKRCAKKKATSFVNGIFYHFSRKIPERRLQRAMRIHDVLFGKRCHANKPFWLRLFRKKFIDGPFDRRRAEMAQLDTDLMVFYILKSRRENFFSRTIRLTYDRKKPTVFWRYINKGQSHRVSHQTIKTNGL